MLRAMNHESVGVSDPPDRSLPAGSCTTHSAQDGRNIILMLCHKHSYCTITRVRVCLYAETATAIMMIVKICKRRKVGFYHSPIDIRASPRAGVSGSEWE